MTLASYWIAMRKGSRSISTLAEDRVAIQCTWVTLSPSCSLRRSIHRLQYPMLIFPVAGCNEFSTSLS